MQAHRLGDDDGAEGLHAHPRLLWTALLPGLERSLQDRHDGRGLGQAELLARLSLSLQRVSWVAGAFDEADAPLSSRKP